MFSRKVAKKVATDHEAPGGEQRGRFAMSRKTKRMTFASAAVLAVVAVLVLPVFSTLQPAYYARYPSLSVRMKDWQSSTHAPWSCAACHVEPGVGGLVSFGIRSIPAFYSQLFFGPSQTNLLRTPTRQACQKCHTSYRTVSPSGDLLIPHRAHVEILKLNCADCHQHLVHWPSATGYNAPRMTYCLARCHDGKKATNKCTKCHTQKQVPLSHKASNWLEVHGSRRHEINCGTCHGWAPKLCDTCHRKRPSTHVGNWKRQHQVRAKRLGVKGCLFCHGGRKFCLKCHDASQFNERS